MVKISVNIINYNSKEYCKKFRGTLLNVVENFNYPYEIVLVDKYSDDGSFGILEEISDTVVQEESNRGEARNTCMEIAEGDVFVDMLDTDEEAYSILADVVNWYVSEMPDWCLVTNSPMINRKDILSEVEGWGNYHAGEDRFLWQRLIDIGKYRWSPLETAQHQRRKSGSIFRKIVKLSKLVPFSIEGLLTNKEIYYNDCDYEYWSEDYRIRNPLGDDR